MRDKSTVFNYREMPFCGKILRKRDHGGIQSFLGFWRCNTYWEGPLALEQAAQGCSWPKGMDHDIFLPDWPPGCVSSFWLHWLWHGSAWLTSELPGISRTFRCIVCQVWERAPWGVVSVVQGCLSLREESFPEDSCGERNMGAICSSSLWRDLLVLLRILSSHERASPSVSRKHRAAICFYDFLILRGGLPTPRDPLTGSHLCLSMFSTEVIFPICGCFERIHDNTWLCSSVFPGMAFLQEISLQSRNSENCPWGT